MEYAYEGDQLSGESQGSVFTTALVDGLETGEADRDHDKWISIDELYGYVYDRVKAENPAQTPTRQGALEGDFYVARSVYEPPVEPAELDEHLLGLVDHPVPEARLGAVDALARLLTSSDKSAALAARQRLEGMREDDSHRVSEHAGAVLADEQARRATEEKRQREGEGMERTQGSLEVARKAEEERQWQSKRQRDGENGSLAVGWYVDPDREEGQRYWDGSAWTEHRVPHGPDAPPGVYPDPYGGGNWRRWDGSRWIDVRRRSALPKLSAARVATVGRVATVCAVLLVVDVSVVALFDEPYGTTHVGVVVGLLLAGVFLLVLIVAVVVRAVATLQAGLNNRTPRRGETRAEEHKRVAEGE